MMLRPLLVRPAVVSATLLFTLLFVACGSRQENTQSANVQNTSTPSGAPGTTANQPVTNTSKAKLNVNTASANDFRTTIPGMGDRMVHEFEEYRPYRSIQQFRREIGKYVSPEQVAEYERYVYVPIAINEADAATLQQIPGLDEKEAAELVTGRPYSSREAFIKKLSEKVSGEELAVGRTYLTNR